MYSCYICKRLAKPKQSRLLFTIYREVPTVGTYDHKTHQMIRGTRKEIAKEIPVCRRCKSLLDAGAGLDRLIRMLRPKGQYREPLERMFPKPQRIDRVKPVNGRE